ncbi:unnamed protein product [Mortierella alpina]
MAASSTHLKWALKKSTGREHVSFGNFVRHFNLADQESASDAFALLISSDQISRDRREKLQKNFKEFCDHHAERFWAERNAKISSEVTAKQAGVISQRVGLKQSEIEYRQHFSRTTGLILSQSAATAAFTGSLNMGVQSTVDEVSTSMTNKTTENAAGKSAEDAISELEEVDVNAPNRQPLHKRVTFLEVEFPSESGSDYVDSKPSSARSSLNSIDFVLIDHVVGPGTTSSQLTTNDRIIMDQVGVSQVLMDGRRNVIRKQNEIKVPSDLLTINFIFNENFLRKHVPKNLSTSLHVRSKIATDEESLAATILHHYTERPYLWQQSTLYPVPSSSLAQNEDTYTQAIVKGIIFGVVGDLELLITGVEIRCPLLQHLRKCTTPIILESTMGFLL